MNAQALVYIAALILVFIAAKVLVFTETNKLFVCFLYSLKEYCKKRKLVVEVFWSYY